MSAVTFLGFWPTYLGPLIAGEIPAQVSSAIHLHAWSFFLWYLLFPLQAGLVAARRVDVHRVLGIVSILLAVLMIATGIIVLGSRLARGSEFWTAFGLLILSTLCLFAVFYGLSIYHRRSPEVHKRYIVLASAAGVGAATFRALLVLPFSVPLRPLTGVLLTNLFVVVAMVRDHRAGKRAHPVYVRGLAVAVLVEGLMVPVAASPVGELLNATLASLGRAITLFN